jgi:hypothetical protein
VAACAEPTPRTATDSEASREEVFMDQLPDEVNGFSRAGT